MTVSTPGLAVQVRGFVYERRYRSFMTLTTIDGWCFRHPRTATRVSLSAPHPQVRECASAEAFFAYRRAPSDDLPRHTAYGSI